MANGYFPLVAPNAGGPLNFEPVNNALMNYGNVRARNQQLEQERQNQNALMQRYQSSDARQNEELAMQKQKFAADQAYRAQMQPLEMDRARMQNAGTQAEIDARKFEMSTKARAQQREDAFLDQFGPTPAPNKLGGPMPEQGGVSRFSSVGMPPPMRAGAPTGQSFNVAEGEPGPGLQVGDPMPKAQPVAPQAAPEQGVTPRQLFDRLSPENQIAARLLLQAGKKEEFVNMLRTGGQTSDKPPTEQQSKDAFFVRRMMDEERTLSQVIPMDPNTGQFTKFDPTKASAWAPNDDTQLAGGWLGTLPTRQYNSEGWKNYYDSARSYIATILRKDTGATVTKEEMDWYFPMLFPQPGDENTVVLNKMRRRQEMMQGLKEAAGPLSDRMNKDYKPQQGYPGQSDRLKSKYGLE